MSLNDYQLKIIPFSAIEQCISMKLIQHLIFFYNLFFKVFIVSIQILFIF